MFLNTMVEHNPNNKIENKFKYIMVDWNIFVRKIYL
jgi:hypothetical protein